MRHVGLAPVTILTLLLTGFLLPASGWFSSNSPRRPAAAEPRKVTAQDLTSDAAWRYRGGRPHHWRALVMQR